MSRASQLYWYLTAEKAMSEDKIKVHLTSLSVTEEVKQARRKFLQQNKQRNLFDKEG